MNLDVVTNIANCLPLHDNKPNAIIKKISDSYVGCAQMTHIGIYIYIYIYMYIYVYT